MTKNLIPCVGFALQYSPLERDSVENFAATLHSKTSELVFDTLQEIHPGQETLILFSNKSRPTQHVPAVVTHCEHLDKEHYRLTLKTQADVGVLNDASNLVCLPINKGPATAHEMVLTCPSCNITGPFRFIATQDGDWEQGILPIYNCGSCGTSRAMIGLVS